MERRKLILVHNTEGHKEIISSKWNARDYLHIIYITEADAKPQMANMMRWFRYS